MRTIGVALFLAISTTLQAQSLPSVVRMTHRITPTEIQVDYEYDADVSSYAATAQLLYQRFDDKGQIVGIPVPVPAGTSSATNHLVFALSSSQLGGAAEIEYYAAIGGQGVTAQSTRSRMTVNAAEVIARDAAKIATLEKTATELRDDNAKLREVLAGPNCAVAKSVKFEEVAANFPDTVWLHFTTPNVGKIRVRVPRGDKTPFEADSFGTDHWIKVKDLTPNSSYSAEAWVLTANNEEKPSSRITKENHDPEMEFKTAAESLRPAFQTLSATAQDNAIKVSYDLDQEVASEVILEQEERDNSGVITYRPAGGTKRRIGLDRFNRPTTLETKGSQEPVTFDTLAPNSIFRVTVNAVNKYGQTVSGTRGNIKTGAAVPPLEFTKNLDISVTPIGYLLTWQATTSPDTEPVNAGPLTDPAAGLKVTFGSLKDYKGATVTAGRDGLKMTAMLDPNSLLSIVAKSKELNGEPPVLTIFMRKGGTTVSRSVTLAFATPSKADVQALALAQPAKDVLKTKLDTAVQKRSINVDWKRLGSEGLKILVDAIF